MNRYIVVQNSASALFGLFSTTVNDPFVVEKAACASCAKWMDFENRPNHLDTSAYFSQVRDELCVFRVPDEIAAYDEDDTDLDASSVHDGRIFDGYRDYDFVGFLGRRSVFTAVHGDKSYEGVSFVQDVEDADKDALDELSRSLPDAQDGDVVDVMDESGKVVGSMTYEADYNAWEFSRKLRAAA